MLEGAYLYLRQFTPDVLQALDFTGGENAQSLITALGVLRQLNATGARKVPNGAPTDFVPARWRVYLEQAARTRRRRRVPALLGADGAPGTAGWAPHRGRVRARFPALLRSGRLPAAAASMGKPAA
jgi:hypothetical protein